MLHNEPFLLVTVVPKYKSTQKNKRNDNKRIGSSIDQDYKLDFKDNLKR